MKEGIGSMMQNSPAVSHGSGFGYPHPATNSFEHHSHHHHHHHAPSTSSLPQTMNSQIPPQQQSTQTNLNQNSQQQNSLHHHSRSSPVSAHSTNPAPHTGPQNVPPIHLASICSLTQLLAELPLPSAMPEGGGGMTLIPNPQMAHYARQLLTNPDPSMTAGLAQALSRSDTSIIALKEPYSRYSDPLPDHLPELAKAILTHNPQVFTPVTTTMTNSQPQTASPAAHTPGQPSEAPRHPTAPEQPRQQSPPAAQTAPETGVTATNQAAGTQIKQPRVLLERMDGIVMGSGPQTPASPASTTTGEAQSTAAKPSRGRDQTQLRKQIVSVGKQPKAQSKRRKDMVSELFDSLTPDAHYFDGSRRKRNQPKTYNDEEYEKPTLSELAATGGIEAGVDDGRVSPASVGSKYGSSSTSKKGRKRHREDSERSYADELDRPLTPTEMIKERNKHWQEILNKRREKLNRRRLMKQYIEDPDELVENESFSRFCRLIDKIFETYEEYDIAVGEEDDEIPPECLIAKKILTELCEKAGKMKSMGVTARVPVDRLVKLLTILEKNVRDAIQLFLVLDPEKEEDEEDEAYRELVSERVFRSADAALTALTIMTSAAMPKQVYIEDAIERSIQLVKNQLTNVIYPAYDAQ